jgi:hypothetical protein
MSNANPIEAITQIKVMVAEDRLTVPEGVALELVVDIVRASEGCELGEVA